MKQSFDITGMSCAACSARVEKVSNAVPGVEKATVNLLKNSMELTYNGAPETITNVVEAITKAGYGAVPRAQNAAALPADAASANALSGAYGTSAGVGVSNKTKENAAAKEAKHVRMRLIVSIIFTVPLFYLSMGHMFSWPLPSVFTEGHNVGVLALTEFLLLIPVIFVNFKFFKNGFSSLVRRCPNMDSLIALGSSASTIYGVVALYRITIALGAMDTETAHMAAMDLYFESAAMILTLITLGKYFEARAKGKTTGAIEALMDLSPKTAIKQVDGEEKEIPIEGVRPGDILVVKAGASVPVDGVVLEGEGTLDESALTGESLPVSKISGAPVTGGTINKAGWFTMRAERVGADTALAGIIQLVDEATSSKAPIEKIADKISSIFVPCVIGIACLTFVVWICVGGSITDALSHAISVLVISCPCALGLATPTAIMVGTGRGAAHGILIKSAEALETACLIKTVVLDKTGTITKGNPEVAEFLWARNKNVPFDEDAFEEECEEVLTCLNSLEAKSEHPLAQAITSFADTYEVDTYSVENFEQVAGGGLKGNINGHACVAGNARLMKNCGIELSSAELFLENGDACTKVIEEVQESFATSGQTVLYFAMDGYVRAVMALADVVKPTSKDAISSLHTKGIQTVMLTGDTQETAQSIQQLVGIDEVIAGVLPSGKDEVIQSIQQGTLAEQSVQEVTSAHSVQETQNIQQSDNAHKPKRTCVAMVGDGINDAPALARADVGIAIGAGTDVAIESADIVLMHSDVMDVPRAISLSRATMRNVKQNLFWALIYNVICIPVAAGAFAWAGFNLNPMIAAAAMSLSSVCVVSNALRLRTWKPQE